MSESSSHFGESLTVDASATVQMSAGQAVLQCINETQKSLHIQYHIPEFHLQLNGVTALERMSEACEMEVAMMCRTLVQLLNGLAEQLSDEGEKAVVDRQYQFDDEREWKLEGDVLRIKESVTDIREVSMTAANVSERSFVAANIHALMKDREYAIRSVYRRMRADATAKGRWEKSV